MKIYLDIVYLINVYLGFLGMLSLGILLNQNIHYKKMLVISFFWGFVVMAIYTSMPYFFFLIWSFLTSFFINRKQILKSFFLWLFLYFTYTTSFLHFGFGFRRIGPIIVVSLSFEWIYAFCLGTFLTVLYLIMTFYLKKDTIKQNFVYSVQIKYQGQIYSCQGFMDTGNQVVIDGLPVIFSCVKIKNGQTIHLDRAGGKQNTNAMMVEIYFQEQWQKVYLAYMEDLQLRNADVLLNLELL